MKRLSLLLLVCSLSLRSIANIYTVTSNADAGANTLRQAIIDANANGGTDTIYFNFGAVTTITLSSCNQQILDPVFIDGYSDPGASAGNLMIEIISPAGCNGINLGVGSDGSIVQGLVINGGAVGIYSNNADNHIIRGNYVGTNVTGTAAAASQPQNGIAIVNSDNVTIGGVNGQIDRNIVSGMTQSGIRFESSLSGVVINNYVGTDYTGNGSIGNGEHGVYCYNNSHDPQVGGATAAESNILSDNSSHGIYMHSCDNPVIQGNTCGMGLDGSTILANNGSGINLEFCDGAQIGGTSAPERNYCSANGSFGIVTRNSDNVVIEGNWIGVDKATGLLDYGNFDAAITATNCLDITIGGTAAGAGNICSASGNPGGGADGISIWQNSLRPIIKGNIIGLGADTVTPLQNYGHGIECLQCEDGLIGGATLNERNYIAESFNRQIQLVSSHRVQIVNNYIGTDVSGLLDRGGDEMGIAVSNSEDVVIGGTTAAERNIISANSYTGIEVNGNSPRTIIKGNLIGVGADGVTSLGNLQEGIKITGNQCVDAVIGGPTTDERNIISANGTGNSHHGINIDGGSSGHTIENNYIGLDETGIIARGNAGNGIMINNVDLVDILDNTISSNAEDGINLINVEDGELYGNNIGTRANGSGDRGNGSEGMRLAASSLDNIIGGSLANANTIAYNDGAAGILLESSAQRNEITFNSIFCNSGLGIDLQGSANESVSAPTVTTSDANTVTGTGTAGMTIHVYRNVTSDGGIDCDCEGEIYIGTTTVGGGGTWSLTHSLGLSTSAADAITATQTTTNGSTSEFTSCTPPLPVELLNFDGWKQGEMNQLVWTTVQEINNDYFVLERSLDGINFSPIATINGAGTYFGTTKYYYEDYDIGIGTYYYRLRQVDFDGTVSYSDIILIQIESSLQIVNIFPHPVQVDFNFIVSSLHDEKVTIEVIDVLSKTHIKYSEYLGSGNNFLRIDVPHHLASGVYILKVCTLEEEVGVFKNFVVAR